MKNPYEECPQFNQCSCNICPLDPAIHDKEATEGDGKCRVRKTTRIKIALKYPELTMKGLNPREFRNKTLWEAKSPAERQLILNRLGKGTKFIKKMA